MEATMRSGTRALYWTEGAADTVIDLVAMGYLRNARAKDVAEALGISASALVAAVKRRPERARRGGGPLCHRKPPPRVSEGYKWCPRCGESKPLDEFGQNKGEAQGKQPYCRGCWSGYATERRQLKKVGA